MIHKLEIQYAEFDSIESLNSMDQLLIKKAQSSLLNAYAPYSNFQVASALNLSNGETFIGTNQENKAYPSAMCAERVAIFTANSNFPNEKIETLVVVNQGGLIDFSKPIYPCGACRQVMIEKEIYQNYPIRLLFVAQNGSVKVFESVKDILPFSF